MPPLSATMRCLGVALFVAHAAAQYHSPTFSRKATGDGTEDAREVVNFDFSWRHHLGNATDPATNCTNGTKGVNFGTGGSMHPNVTMPAECCALCENDASCNCWDFNIDGSSYGQCWTKSDGCDKSVENPLRFSGTVPTRPPAPAVPKEAEPSFADAQWQLVDAPHDMLITQPYNPAETEKMGFIARNVGWYRKHFYLPQEWEDDSAVWLYIEGSFHVTTMWVNGHEVTQHVQGYTSFAVRLDNVDGIHFGKSEENVIALYVDASSGTGWWYEGGGLMRHQYLVRANPVHLNPTGSAWVYAQNISLSEESAVFVVNAEVDNDSSDEKEVVVRAIVRDGEDKEVASATSATASKLAGSSSRNELPAVEVAVSSGVQFWSVTRPYLYSVEVSILSAATMEEIDAVNVTAGVRTIRWDADKGLYLNSQPVKLRGFCDHSSFAGVGAALGDRVNLFRAQALRSVGGNSWRMAHNPPSPTRLDFMDRLGMLAVDENRDYGGHVGQGGNTSETVTQELDDMADLVRRDRSHASVMIWSFCNEVGCDNESSAEAFREVSKQWDPTRAVTQNHNGNYDVSGKYLDVQGFSHKKLADFSGFHIDHPDVPIMATECCSCMSQRGVDEDTCPQPADGGCVDPPAALPSGVFYNNNIGQCTAEQVADSDLTDYVTGTFVWSGFDYIGEARGWPQNTKCRGTIADVAGFTKETAYWLRSWWLSNISASDAGRPTNPPALLPAATGVPSVDASITADTETTLFILEAWLPPANATLTPNRTIHVYSNAPFVKLLLNGEPAHGGDLQEIPFFGMATFGNVTYEAGNLTAVAQDAEQRELASYTVLSTGRVAGVHVSIDAPTPTTGTGSYVVADGEDVALIRASLVDSNGLVVPQASNNVTFKVVSGPGAIWATHSGDPANLSPNHAPWTTAYHGLARAFVRTTEDSATALSHRRRRAQVDAEPSPNIKVVLDDNYAPGDIVVQATVQIDGATSVTSHVSIPVSADVHWAPRAVASRLALGKAEATRIK